MRETKSSTSLWLAGIEEAKKGPPWGPQLCCVPGQATPLLEPKSLAVRGGYGLPRGLSCQTVWDSEPFV